MGDVPHPMQLAERIDQLLPQTQCRQCGYAGCRPYAEAVAAGRAAINQCPPGGDDVIREIAELLNVPFQPLDPAFGRHLLPAVAVIDEARCIGCTLCIAACPVDAIVGAARLMHTVIAAECTGCRLCIPTCPVDCIDMRETGAEPSRGQRHAAAARARRRFLARNERLARERKTGPAPRAAAAQGADEKKRLTVRRAIERARARLRQDTNGSR
jgi:electron transport complex protein RnfB